MMKEGLMYTSTVNVTEENCAQSVGSGSLKVFATPSLAAVMENAAMMAVADCLPDDSTTVGGEISIKHLRPSAIGEVVSATAKLVQVDGRRLVYELSASDSKGVIGEGTHTRFVVNIEKFMSRL